MSPGGNGPGSQPSNLNLKGGGLQQRSPRPEPTGLTVPAVSSSTVPPQWTAHYQQLVQYLDRLGASQRLHLREAAETRPGFSMSMADGATDEVDRDVLLGEAASEQDLIYEIQQALKRIENGTYGICEVTGKPIPPARLRAVPWTRFTQEVERRLEADRAVRPTHLGELRSVRLPVDAPPLFVAARPKKKRS